MIYNNQCKIIETPSERLAGLALINCIIGITDFKQKKPISSRLSAVGRKEL